MSSTPPVEFHNAETRFRQAFERLKGGTTTVLTTGAPVTQNNVAREAGCDPSALKKARFPALIREIQSYLELRKIDTHVAAQKASKQKAVKRSLEKRLDDALRQRDQAQSILANANLRIVELTDAVLSLQRRLDETQSPPTKLGRR